MKTIFAVLSTTLALTVTLTATTTERPHIILASTDLASGAVNTAYFQTLTEQGGVAPYTWSLSKNSALPAGLTLDPTTGVISGVARKAGKTLLIATVSDSSFPTLSSTQSYSMNIAEEQLSIPATMLTAGVVHKPYTEALLASGGTPPYTWSVSGGQLPDGITLDPATGVLSGVTTHPANESFTIQVKDSSAKSMMGRQRLRRWVRSR